MSQQPRPSLTLPPADEAVDDILRAGERRQAEAVLSADERRSLIQKRRRLEEQKRKARQKAAAQKPNRTYLLLPQALKSEITSLASWNKVTESQVVTFLLYEALIHYRSGEIDFGPYKVPCSSPRYEYTLIHPEDQERTEKRSGINKKSGWRAD
jgi:hypothetical protein